MTNWISRWESNRIGWHAEQVNRHLVQYYDRFDLSGEGSIFVPLCGKSNDMRFLLEKNLKVIGVEMSSIAIEQFFQKIIWILLYLMKINLPFMRVLELSCIAVIFLI